MPTIEQIKAARALIGWSQGELAECADMSQTGIARIENGSNQPNSTTLGKITTAFDKADIEFIDDSGVRKRSGDIRTLKGKIGFAQFLDEIYDFAKNKGGLICLHNANPDNWQKWIGQNHYNIRSEMMDGVKNNIDFRITAKEGQKNLISSSFAEYRLIPEDIYNDQSIYAFGDSLAFISFLENDVVIRILKNESFTKGFQALFNVTWDNVAKKIS